MKLFNLDSPLMQWLGKMADLMWLNILTLICCIPIFTAGAAFTALNYMALKIVRDEECYITKGYFKSFKENFKQATGIWLLYLLADLILVGDFYIIRKSGIQIHKAIQVVICIVGVLIIFTGMFLFPTLAKFENTFTRTIKNSFIISILQFPKTILMIILYLLPPVAAALAPQIMPVTFLFGFSLPAFLSAKLYNKFFKKLEDQVTAAAGEGQEGEASEKEGEDERIFKDELDESLIDQQEDSGKK